jgi:hypothetical protein
MIYLHGLSGIGKSTLSVALCQETRERGGSVLALDGKLIEPTPHGFLSEMANGLGCEPSLAAVSRSLAGLPEPVLISLDGYELLTLLDAWLRQALIPALPEKARVLVCSRLPPSPGWLEAPEWRGLLRVLRLEGLDEEAANALLRSFGVEDDRTCRLVRFAAGHPLALTLAATADAAPAAGRAGDPIERVLHQLAQRFLDDIADRTLREALRAACVVRRITRPLLGALVEAGDPASLYERLQALPIVAESRDGLVVHDAVRDAVAADLQAQDPTAHGRYRRAAWRQLSLDARSAPAADLWRYTADLLFLIGNPVIREAFFPREASRLSVEPALPADQECILDLARRHEATDAVELLKYWCRKAPASFHVVRSAQDPVAGFYCLLQPERFPGPVLDRDPIFRAWRAHLAAHPVGAGQTAVFIGRWLSKQDGESPSPTQAACWLDIKRHYMELRPRLRRVYMTFIDPTPFAGAAETLRIKLLPQPVALGSDSYQTAILDMGPASVEGWLSEIIAAELGVPLQGILDPAKRALSVRDRSVPLTRREFDVLAYLAAREGTAVSRSELIHNVWGLRFDAGSNVVDAVIASLRRKLEDLAPAIETVRGYGYSYRAVSGH